MPPADPRRPADPPGPAELPAPPAVRRAGLVVVLQGVLGLVLAGVLALGASSDSVLGARTGYATAGFIGLFGAAAAALGAALVRGRRGARAPAIVLQILLLGVAWYTASGSGQVVAGVVVGAVAVVVVALLVGPSTSDWVAAQYVPPLAEPGTAPPGIAEVRARRESELSERGKRARRGRRR